MGDFFVMMVCLAVAVPLTVAAWAMRKTHCPNCGAEVGPDADLVKTFFG